MLENLIYPLIVGIIPLLVSFWLDRKKKNSESSSPYSPPAPQPIHYPPTNPNYSQRMNGIIKLALVVFLPPVAVYLEKGIGQMFWVNVLLTIFLYWLPGVFHAFFIIFKPQRSI